MLDNILDSLIDHGRATANANRLNQSMMGAVVFAKEFATVALNPGRLTGKTMAVARRVKPTDIVFSYNNASHKEMERRVQFFNSQAVECKSADATDIDTEREYDTVWVDEATHLKPGQLDAIYEVLAEKAKYFVLIG
jgi:hypothetical protein